LILLGIDPGTASTGYAVVDIGGKKPELLKAAVISTPAKDLMHRRLKIRIRSWNRRGLQNLG